MKKILVLLFSIFSISATAVFAAGNELAYLKFQELTTMLRSAIDDTADYTPVWDATDGKVKKVLAVAPARDFVNICGEATTVNNNTVYYGPATSLYPNSGNGQGCDINATGNTTEATADTPIFNDKAVQVVSMTCRNEQDANADITFTLRDNAGPTVPSVTCTIADNKRDCQADVQTTTPIAAGHPIAVAVSSTADIADNNGFFCTVQVTY